MERKLNFISPRADPNEKSLQMSDIMQNSLFSSRKNTHRIKVVLDGYHRQFLESKLRLFRYLMVWTDPRRISQTIFGVKIETVKVSNGLDGLKVALHVCPNHGDDGI